MTIRGPHSSAASRPNSLSRECACTPTSSSSGGEGSRAGRASPRSPSTTGSRAAAGRRRRSLPRTVPRRVLLVSPLEVLAFPSNAALHHPDGYRKLAGELERLWKVERPRVTRQVADAAALGDRSENAEYIYGKKRLREIDGRVHFLASGSRSWRWCARPSGTTASTSGRGWRSRARTARASNSGSWARTSSTRRCASSAWSRRWPAPCSASRWGTRWWWRGPRAPARSPSCGSGIRRAPGASGDAMSVCAVTGSASGIGAAIRRRLEKDGARVIGIDLRDAEIVADLRSPEGREAAVAGVLARCSRQLDRLVVAAGVGSQVKPPSLVASINYFGAVDLLDGLFEALRGGTAPAALAVASNSAQMARVDESPSSRRCSRATKLKRAGSPTRSATRCSPMSAPSTRSRGRCGAARASGSRGRAHRRAGAGARAHAAADGRHGRSGDGRRDPEVPGAARAHGRAGGDRRARPHSCWAGGSYIQGSIYYIDGGSDAELRPDRF